MKIHNDALRAIFLAQKLREEFVAGDAVENGELYKALESHGFAFIHDPKVRRYAIEKTQAGFMLLIPTITSEHQDRLYLAQILGARILYGRAESSPFEGLDKKSCRAIAAFAAEFLMPRERFVEYAKAACYDVEKIASHFGVSKAAARVRIAALRIVIPGMPEQARREAWRCLRWLVALWVVIVVAGALVAAEFLG